MKLLCWLCLLLLPAWSARAYSEQAPLAAARSDMSRMKTSLDAFKVDCGRFPSTAEGWDALIHCPEDGLVVHWHGPYLENIPLDPWGNPYAYACPGRHNTNGYDLYSCGADGLSKTQGSDLNDLNNWDPASPHGGNWGPPRPWPIHSVILGNLVFFTLAVWLSIRTEPATVSSSADRRQWAGMAAMLWFAQGLGWAGFLHLRFQILTPGDLRIVLIWWIIGLALAISGMRSRCRIGTLTGALALLELVGFFLAIITRFQT